MSQTVGRQPTPFYFARIPLYLKYFFQILFNISLSSLPLITIKKLKFKINSLYDLIVLKEVLIENCYTKHLSLDGKIIVDIGAGFGDFAILAAKTNPDSKIYAVEPDENLRKYLRENIKLNNIKNIIILNKFLKNFNEIGIEKIDFLKIDCEGCEFPLFQKISINNLKKIKKIAMEYHESKNHKISSIISKLEAAGFKFIIESKDSKAYPGLGLLWAWKDKS